MMRVFVAAALVFLSLVYTEAPATAARRALVIAEEHYPNPPLPALTGVTAEATTLANTLQSLGFTVTRAPDVKEAAFRSALNGFLASIAPGDIVVISYSGHGMQAGGVNYLLPLDAVPDPNVPLVAINLDTDILSPLGTRNAAASIVFIDACRNLPFLPTKGLTRPNASPSSTYVVFSTGPGTTSLNPSPFAKSLVEHIGEPGEPIEGVIKEVTADVVSKTASAMRPQTYGSPLSQVVLRPATTVTLTAGKVDDKLSVFIDGNPAPSAEWGLGEGGSKDIFLKKGAHPIVVQVFNQRSFTPIITGHLPEGWSYSLDVSSQNAKITALGDGEDRPAVNGPRFGGTFTVATFTLNVDPHTGTVTISNLAPHVWQH